MNLFDCVDGKIFLISRNSVKVLDTDSIRDCRENATEVSVNDIDCQTILLSAPVERPLQLLVSADSARLVLVCERAVLLVNLPGRWGPDRRFAGGKRQLPLAAKPVDPRLFGASRSLRAVKATWHPASLHCCHLVLLTSDNIVRVYDLADSVVSPQQRSVPVGSRAGETPLIAAGENLVSLAFGPRLVVGSIPRPTWPLYLLTSAGDVYCWFTSLDRYSRNRDQSVQGPLVIQPPAEDNYGTEACELICLNCADPPLLVFVNSSGTIYHCIVVHTVDEDDGSPLAPVMFVHSAVSLFGPDLLSSDLSPFLLSTDPLSPDVYYCLHGSGIHLVELSWLHTLRNMGTESESCLLALCGGDSPTETRIENLLSTRISLDSSARPVEGVALTSDSLSESRLFCSLSGAADNSLILLTARKRPFAVSLSSSAATASNTRAHHSHGDQQTPSPWKRPGAAPTSFSDQIRAALQRKQSQPFLRTGEGALDDTALDLLGQVTQTLRGDYMDKLESARQRIQTRVSLLSRLKAEQSTELAQTTSQLQQLLDRFTSLRARHDELSQKQSALADRTASLMRQLNRGVPVLSDHERESFRELRSIDSQLDNLKELFEQARGKYQFQRRLAQDANANSSPADHRPSRSFGSVQRQALEQLLNQESESLTELVNSVKSIQLSTADTPS